MKVPELKGGQMLTLAYFAAFFIALFVVYKLLGKLGIIKTAAKKKAEVARTAAAEELRTSEYFDVLLLKKYPNYKSIQPLASRYAGELYKAIHTIAGTDEEAIYSVFGKLDNRLNVSEVALFYKGMFKEDLSVKLLNDLTDKEQVILVDLINKLPTQ